MIIWYDYVRRVPWLCEMIIQKIGWLFELSEMIILKLVDIFVWLFGMIIWASMIICRKSPTKPSVNSNQSYRTCPPVPSGPFSWPQMKFEVSPGGVFSPDQIWSIHPNAPIQLSGATPSGYLPNADAPSGLSPSNRKKVVRVVTDFGLGKGVWFAFKLKRFKAKRKKKEMYQTNIAKPTSYLN